MSQPRKSATGARYANELTQLWECASIIVGIDVVLDLLRLRAAVVGSQGDERANDRQDGDPGKPRAFRGT